MALSERILAVLAGASSAHPANAADVIAITGRPEAECWPVIEQLLRDRRIQTAHMQTAGHPWVALWPSGVQCRTARVTSNQLSGLFVRHDPSALKKAHMPRTRP